MLKLTPRETLIAGLVSRGKSDKEIPSALNIAVRTTRFHIANIFKKLRVTNRASLATKVVVYQIASRTFLEESGDRSSENQGELP
jgi:DNA-binding NarL/FixJ family response regulator